ncbi:unnamed protein product [Cylindrotheca closterium]|uniref:SnoaL-like domain-containing protein n=1 Tax=Cylindrotheca closterium TaxID=2856 RepID=A0AAD2FEG3_9STRA|nr:unnamed protein product [Cylindrotheca closterium]
MLKCRHGKRPSVCISLMLNLMIFSLTSAFSATGAISRSANSRTCLHSNTSSEDSIIQLPQWQAQLAETTDPEKKASLESKIDQAKMSAEFGVRAAQSQFYEAFSNQDYDLMQAIWSNGQDIQCNHPGMPRITGREDILKSWKALFEGPQMDMEPTDSVVDICGGTAICRCVEQIDTSSRLEALNIYKREEGEWKMTFHMASPVLLGQADLE